MTLPAPVIETFSDSLTATSACDAPVDEISAVLVWSDSASNLLAPVISVTRPSTVPSRRTLAAPVDSIPKLCPESCFAVSRAAPVSFAPARVELRSEEHTSELQSHHDLVCRLLLEKKKLC